MRMNGRLGGVRENLEKVCLRASVRLYVCNTSPVLDDTGWSALPVLYKTLTNTLNHEHEKKGVLHI